MRQDGYHDHIFDDDEDREIMTIAEFKAAVEQGGFNDDDGYGALMANDLYLYDPKLAGHKRRISPSEVHLIPLEATHIDWYNK
jgi:DNA polymerase/3'-5' exonuclease PolX